MRKSHLMLTQTALNPRSQAVAHVDSQPVVRLSSHTHDGLALLQCALHLSPQNVHHCEVAIAEGICGKMVCFQRMLNCLYSNFILTASSADDTQVANGIDIFCPIGSSF